MNDQNQRHRRGERPHDRQRDANRDQNRERPTDRPRDQRAHERKDGGQGPRPEKTHQKINDNRQPNRPKGEDRSDHKGGRQDHHEQSPQPKPTVTPAPAEAAAQPPAPPALQGHGPATLFLGQPGTGKTFQLIQAAAASLTAGVPAHAIALTTFSFRTEAVLRTQAAAQQPAIAGALIFQPVRDWVFPVLQRQAQSAGQPSPVDISNNEIRRLLRGLILTQSFRGTLEDAEHVIRAAKGRAKKLPDNDPHFAFVAAYNELLRARGWLDRHDILRQHLLGMRNRTLPPLPVTHLLVDHLQDATELQLLWLREHHLAGVAVTMAANDDLTAFGEDGAQGAGAITAVQAWPGLRTQLLSTQYRQPAALAAAGLKVVRFLGQRSGLADEAISPVTTPAELHTQQHAAPADEHRWLAAEAVRRAGQGQKNGYTVGIITRDDYTAAVITHILRKNGINPASYARLIWEETTPQTVLALLSLLLDRASNVQLAMVLGAFGVPPAALGLWLQQGRLEAAGWLARGAVIPSLAETGVPAETAAALEPQLSRLSQFLQQAWQALTQRLLDPRSVFKACVQELLDALPGDMTSAAGTSEDPLALLATDMLLSLSGNLADILPRVTQETLPDIASPITVAPVREARGLQFDAVLVAGLTTVAQGPHPAWPRVVSGPVADHERRLFYLAASRTKQTLILSHTGPLSPLSSEFQQAFKNAQRLEKR